jgi:hypothetical protein
MDDVERDWIIRGIFWKVKVGGYGGGCIYDVIENINM